MEDTRDFQMLALISGFVAAYCGTLDQSAPNPPFPPPGCSWDPPERDGWAALSAWRAGGGDGVRLAPDEREALTSLNHDELFLSHERTSASLVQGFGVPESGKFVALAFYTGLPGRMFNYLHPSIAVLGTEGNRVVKLHLELKIDTTMGELHHEAGERMAAAGMSSGLIRTAVLRLRDEGKAFQI